MKEKFTERLRLSGECEEMIIMHKKKTKEESRFSKIYSDAKQKRTKVWTKKTTGELRKWLINREKVGENENIKRIKPKNKVRIIKNNFWIIKNKDRIIKNNVRIIRT